MTAGNLLVADEVLDTEGQIFSTEDREIKEIEKDISVPVYKVSYKENCKPRKATSILQISYHTKLHIFDLDLLRVIFPNSHSDLKIKNVSVITPRLLGFKTAVQIDDFRRRAAEYNYHICPVAMVPWIWATHSKIGRKHKYCVAMTEPLVNSENLSSLLTHEYYSDSYKVILSAPFTEETIVDIDTSFLFCC